MKKEILRVHDLNLQIDGAYGLSDISFCLMAGDAPALWVWQIRESRCFLTYYAAI